MDTNSEKLNKLISVQICTYNRANFILKAIKSALGQTYTNIEIVVVDDASTDNTKELVRNIDDPRIKYFKNSTNIGISRNRNVALEKCSGEYVAILDSDDYWIDNEKLEKQISFLENNPDFAVIGTQAKLINDRGDAAGQINVCKDDKNIRKNILRRNQFINSSVLMKKNLINEVDGYDENLQVGEDYDLFMKLGIKYKLANLESSSIAYRTGHENSMSNKVLAAKTHHNLINKYKKYYPGYMVAILKSYIRLLKAVLKH
jgi:glycosyltransferase involved in cell wall biosynthesis